MQQLIGSEAIVDAGYLTEAQHRTFHMVNIGKIYSSKNGKLISFSWSESNHQNIDLDDLLKFNRKGS